jgi:hypothetical protein
VRESIRRSIRQESSFEESARNVERDARRFDDLYRGVEWQIAVNAESCPEVAGTPFRMARAYVETGLLRVLFTINSNDLCSVWWVDIAEDAEEEDASI